jgi:AsmA protein
MLKGQTAPASSGPNKTDFSEIKGTATITNGLVQNNDLIANSPLLRVTGKGNAHLVSEKIDYAVTAKLVGSLEGQSAQDAEDMRKLSIPIIVSGTFAQPSYKLDLKSMLAETQKAKIEEKKQEVQEKASEKLKEKLGDGAGGLLKKLF